MRGHNPAWSNLPRRHCDDCGKLYKPVQPLRKDTRGFCSDNCRKSYHKHGGAYRKLKGEMQKMVKRGIDLGLSACIKGLEEHFREIVRQESGHINAELKELRAARADIPPGGFSMRAGINPPLPPKPAK
jgi:hypothetical protein